MFADAQVPDPGFLAVWMALITTAGAAITLWLNKKFDSEKKACESALANFEARLNDCQSQHAEAAKDREDLRPDLAESRADRSALRLELDLLRRQTGFAPPPPRSSPPPPAPPEDPA